MYIFHIYLGIALSHKKECDLFAEMWMDLVTVIQSEVSHKEKNKYHILMHICGIEKNVMDELICKADIEIQRTNIWIPNAEGGWDGLGEWYWHIHY